MTNNDTYDGLLTGEVAPTSARKKLGARGLMLCVVIAGTAVGLAVPWAFHIDGGLTLMFWQATGKLHTRGGTYPLYVLMYPASRGSELQGWGSLCVSQKQVIPLELYGSFRGGWWSLENTRMEIRLVEPNNVHDAFFDPNHRGGFSLYGGWRGRELVLNDARESVVPFRSGLKVEQASVRFTRGTKSLFNNACRDQASQ